MIRYDALDLLPVRRALPALTGALEEHGTAVLVAPPGTGKTTLVPLVLAGLVGGGPTRRVVVAEPRRIAARAAARRMAWLLGEQVGDSVGYSVRGERLLGRHARVEVVTTGLLLQRLLRDQELESVDVVVLDECHERHLDADTVAAFLLDVRAALRPELRLVAASATTDAEGCELLAVDCAQACSGAHGWVSGLRQVRLRGPERGFLGRMCDLWWGWSLRVLRGFPGGAGGWRSGWAAGGGDAVRTPRPVRSRGP